MSTRSPNVSDAAEAVARLERAVERVIKGKSDAVRAAIIALLSRGHMLIEDVPGVGKTTLAYCLARGVSLEFRRIQFTSDLMPSDILGVSVLDPEAGEFAFKPGPVFSNVVLADEINRATPKTQSALLEAMNEGSVTMDGMTHALPRPFFVIATQNPYEHKGTFPLPESQLDRFCIRISMGYPDPESEKEILLGPSGMDRVLSIEPVLGREELLALQDMAASVHVDDSLLDYMLRIVNLTRDSSRFELGVSPRGTLALKAAAQARALAHGRSYCIPDDIKEMVVPVLAHRVVLGRDAGAARGEEAYVLRELVDSVPVPV